jgi:prephenate dehydrogenase
MSSLADANFAASDADRADEPHFRPVKVGIIGGRGRMGRWLTGFLGARGHQIVTAGRGDDDLLPDLARSCPVIVLAVPVTEVEAVMRRVGPHTDPDGVVMDLTSLKEVPVQNMLAHARGEVIGLHPLFGPGADSAAGRVVFACPARGRRWWVLLHRYLRSQGARVRIIEPGEHDRLMAQVQSLRHLWLSCLGQTLGAVGYEPAASGDVSGPWLRTLLSLLARQSSQPADLYVDLALNNPHLIEVLRELNRSLTDVIDCLEAGDRPALIEMMTEAASLVNGVKPDKVVD